MEEDNIELLERLKKKKKGQGCWRIKKRKENNDQYFNEWEKNKESIEYGAVTNIVGQKKKVL